MFSDNQKMVSINFLIVSRVVLEHLDHLRAFVATVETGSFSAAARQLGRAQSVVSTHMALLEADLGVMLFDRRGRYPELTEAGRGLLGEAREVLRQCAQMEGKALALSCQPESEVRLALDEGLPYTDIQTVCVELAERFPQVRLQLLHGSTWEVQEWVARGLAHMGVSYDAPILQSDELDRQWLHTVEQVGVVATGHPLAQLTRVTQRDLARYRQIVIRFALESQRPPLVLSPSTWETNSSFVAADLALRGLGWAILPMPVVTYEGVLEGLSILRPETGFPVLNMQLFRKTGQPLNGVTEWLVKRLGRDTSTTSRP